MKRKRAKRITFQGGVLESSCHLILLILNLVQFLHSMNVFYFCPFSDNSFLKKFIQQKWDQFLSPIHYKKYLNFLCYAKMCIILCPSLENCTNNTTIVRPFQFIIQLHIRNKNIHIQNIKHHHQHLECIDGASKKTLYRLFLMKQSQYFYKI